MSGIFTRGLCQHFNVNYWLPFWLVSCSEAALSTASAAPVSSSHLAQWLHGRPHSYNQDRKFCVLVVILLNVHRAGCVMFSMYCRTFVQLLTCWRCERSKCSRSDHTASSSGVVVRKWKYILLLVEVHICVFSQHGESVVKMRYSGKVLEYFLSEKVRK